MGTSWISHETLSQWTNRGRFLLVLIALTTSPLTAEDPPGWSRSVIAEPSGTDRPYDFSLGVVTKDKRQFTGRWFYANYEHSQVHRFEATKDPIGIVWPAATLYVLDDISQQWINIGKSKPHGKKITIRVAPGADIDLFVDFEPFIPFIGKRRLGKVTLSSGRNAQFELKYLLPPASDKDAAETGLTNNK
jgi:hypothetical protein